MRREHIEELVCPRGPHGLTLQHGAIEEQGEIKTGELRCSEDGLTVPIRGFVPRFVPDSGYSENFGEQWNRFRRTQLDKFNGTSLSKERAQHRKGWPKSPPPDHSHPHTAQSPPPSTSTSPSYQLPTPPACR